MISIRYCFFNRISQILSILMLLFLSDSLLFAQKHGFASERQNSLSRTSNSSQFQGRRVFRWRSRASRRQPRQLRRTVYLNVPQGGPREDTICGTTKFFIGIDQVSSPEPTEIIAIFPSNNILIDHPLDGAEVMVQVCTPNNNLATIDELYLVAPDGQRYEARAGTVLNDFFLFDLPRSADTGQYELFVRTQTSVYEKTLTYESIAYLEKPYIRLADPLNDQTIRNLAPFPTLSHGQDVRIEYLNFFGVPTGQNIEVGLYRIYSENNDRSGVLIDSWEIAPNSDGQFNEVFTVSTEASGTYILIACRLSDDSCASNNFRSFFTTNSYFIDRAPTGEEGTRVLIEYPFAWHGFIVSDPNPILQDTDGDSLFDHEETLYFETNPNDSDTDDDGLSDSYELGFNDLGVETNPLRIDSDEDGLQDGTELGISEGEEGTSIIFIPDSDPDTTTDPNNPDSDGDGLLDGEEDSNKDGAIINTIGDSQTSGNGETDPNIPDTDADGLSDKIETRSTILNPLDSDSDNDGINDGDEVALNTTGGIPGGGQQHPDPPSSPTVTVKHGEYLSLIARRYSISIRSLANANSRSIHSPLIVGEQLFIPPVDSSIPCYRYIQAEGTETIATIANRLHIKPSGLADVNQISKNVVLDTGTRICIPDIYSDGYYAPW